MPEVEAFRRLLWTVLEFLFVGRLAYIVWMWDDDTKNKPQSSLYNAGVCLTLCAIQSLEGKPRWSRLYGLLLIWLLFCLDGCVGSVDEFNMYIAAALSSNMVIFLLCFLIERPRLARILFSFHFTLRVRWLPVRVKDLTSAYGHDHPLWKASFDEFCFFGFGLFIVHCQEITYDYTQKLKME